MAPILYTVRICGICMAGLGMTGGIRDKTARCDICLSAALGAQTFRLSRPAADLRMALPSFKTRNDEERQKREEKAREDAAKLIELKALQLAAEMTKNQSPVQIRAKLKAAQTVVPERKRKIDVS